MFGNINIFYVFFFCFFEIVCFMGYDSIVEFFLEKGVNFNIYNFFGFSLFFLVILCNNEIIMQYLFDNGVDVNIFDLGVNFFLYVLGFLGLDNIIDILLKNKNVNIDICDFQIGIRFFYVVCENGCYSIV